MWKTTGEVANNYGVSRTTIVRWVKDGQFVTKRTHGGHYRIWVTPSSKIVLYARVSSRKQKSSITTQRKLLLKQYPQGEFISDIGSGFNFKRRGFVTILEQAMSGVAIQLVSTTSDRITRSGFPLVKRILELHGGTVELLEEDICAERFDVHTLVSFLTSFCNSQSGKRSSRRKRLQED